MKNTSKEPNYDQLIMTWFKKATEEDYFSKFIYLYLSFDALLRKRYFVNSTQDREAIESLKKATKIKEMYFEDIKKNRELEATFEKLINVLKKESLKNISRNNGEVKEIKIESKEDWNNLIEFIYIVRNNLFHGEKNPESLRDFDMVFYAYKLLMPLVIILLSYQARDLGIDDYDLKKLKEIMENARNKNGSD